VAFHDTKPELDFCLEPPLCASAQQKRKETKRPNRLALEFTLRPVWQKLLGVMDGSGKTLPHDAGRKAKSTPSSMAGFAIGLP
jgi:hypothetical protein